MSSDTIYAVSSGATPCAIAVLRLSGPQAIQAANRFVVSLPPPRTAGLRAIRHPETLLLLDRAVVLIFPQPDTATGEDVVELHLHGGRAVVRAVEAMLAQLPGLRPAGAGEFTRRALSNGRIDLTEAEALGDLLAAETEAQRRSAMRQVEGGMRRAVEKWRVDLLTIAGRVEALLDFSDEDDVHDDDFRPKIFSLARSIETLLAVPPSERLRDGLHVVLAGPPNSGKSTLLNALGGRDAAIVSPIAGTTRDRIEVPVVRGGIAYLLIDTAGLRDESSDPIERAGIARSERAVLEADVLVWMGDDAPPRSGAIWVHGRADIAGREQCPAGPSLIVAATTGAGIEALWEAVAAQAKSMLPPADALTVNQRQRALLGQGAAALRSAGDAGDLLMVAEDLRQARATLDQITGNAGVEDMLDALFGQFCIGK